MENAIEMHSLIYFLEIPCEVGTIFTSILQVCQLGIGRLSAWQSGSNLCLTPKPVLGSLLVSVPPEILHGCSPKEFSVGKQKQWQTILLGCE